MNIEEKINQIDSLKSEIDRLRPIDADQERRVMQKFKLDWNYNSNAIEGNTLSIGETAALLSYGLTARGKPLKDHLDITGHDTALDMLTEYVRDNERLTEYLIRGLHKEMLGETREVSSVDASGIRSTRVISAGAYKTIANHVQTASGVIRMFSQPIETPAMMHDLVDWYARERDVPTLHPLILAATFHHRFVSIHPFDDGNGRLARILMNLIIMQHGYMPAIFRTAERDAYISSLVQADAGDLQPLLEMVIDECARSSEIYISAAKGGMVDELSDFDKQLSLLTKSVLSSTQVDGEKATPQDHLRVFETLMMPVFESVSARFSKFESLFAATELTLLAKHAPAEILLKRNLAEFRSLVTPALQHHVLTEARLFFKATGFVKDSAQDMILSLHFFFHPQEFLLTCQTGSPVEIFRSDYSALFTQQTVEMVSKAVLEMILQKVQSLVKT